MVDLFVRHKISFNEPNKEGFFPIHMAVRKGQFQAIKFLVDNQHAPNLKMKLSKANSLTGWTSLHLAAHFGQLKILKKLIKVNLI